MKEYKKPLIEDECVEIDDICSVSGLTQVNRTEDEIINDEGESY